jgi:hypothetical protein
MDRDREAGQRLRYMDRETEKHGQRREAGQRLRYMDRETEEHGQRQGGWSETEKHGQRQGGWSNIREGEILGKLVRHWLGLMQGSGGWSETVVAGQILEKLVKKL